VLVQIQHIFKLNIYTFKQINYYLVLIKITIEFDPGSG